MYGFTGREGDASGLVYMRARYYSPQFGRFISRDPIGLQGGISSTAYADGNPISNNDPSGLIANSVSNTVTNYAGQVSNWLSSPSSPSLLATTTIGLPNISLPSLPSVVSNVVNTVSPIVDTISTKIPSLVPVLPAISLPGGIVGTVLTVTPGNIGQNVQDQLYGPYADPKYSPIYNSQNGGVGCIYCVNGTNTSSGKDYVGSTDNLDQRQRDTTDGRNRVGAQVVDTYTIGNRDERRRKEQQAINNRGGVDNLDNKRNEIAPGKWQDKGVTPP